MPQTRSSIPLITAAALLAVVGNITPVIQPLLVGIYVDRFGLSNAQAGYLAVCEMSCFALAAFPCAAVIRKWGLARLAAAGLLVSAAANLLSAGSVSVEMMIAARALAGAGAGAVVVVSANAAAATPQPDRSFSIVSMSVLAFAGLLLTAAPFVMREAGQATGFLVMAAPSLLASAALPLLPKRRGSDEGLSLAAGLSGVAPRLRFGILTAALLLYAGHGAVWTFEERMGVRIGMSATEIGAALGSASVAGFLGAAAASALGLRLGRVVPQAMAFVGSAAAALLIVYAADAPAYRWGAWLIAATWFFGLPYLSGVAAALDPSGRLAGFVAAMLNLGTALGPFLAAGLIQWGDFRTIGWVAATFYIACLVLVLEATVHAEHSRPGEAQTQCA